MSLSAKFWTAFALIATLASGLAAYGTWALGRTGDLIARLYDEPLVGVSYARAASVTFSEARRLMDRSLLLQDGRSGAAAGLLRHKQQDIAGELLIVRQRMHDPAVTNALDAADQSVAVWFHSGAMVLAPPPEGLPAIPMPDLIERQSAAANARLDDLVELVAANGFTYRARAVAEISASRIVLIGLCCGIILMCALFVLLLAHLLIRPIRAAIRIAESIAAGNDASVFITTRRDEIGRLLGCLAAMQVNLRSKDAQAVVLLREKDEAAEALRRTNLHLDAALNNMSHGLMMCDSDSRVVIINRQYCEAAGVDPGLVVPNIPYRDVLALSVAAGNHPGRSVDEVLAEQTRIFRSNQPAVAVRTNAAGKTIEISVVPMPDGGWIATKMDISERRRSEERIIFLARHDALTLLPNRVLFQERLDQALVQAQRGTGFALLWVDLDRFKAVNDVLGHPVGDSLLRAVADRLRDVLRETDTVARFGGDEFAVLQAGVSTPAEATILAERIVRAIGRPFVLAGHQISIGISVGIVLVPAGGGAHPVQLMKDADQALYRAKQDGRGTWRFFEPAMDTSAKARREMELELSTALSSRQFELHYQPLVCSQRRTLTGFETLLRWRHPTRGLVSPAEFITAAEEMGIIVPIGAWVLRQACIEAATWPDHLRVAVNLSPLQFRDGNLLATVADALKVSGLRPQRLEFEITESLPLGNDNATLSILHALHALGARIALDDFGTGYSSLSYLRCFPFDTIKIDRSFVSELASREDCVAIVRAISALGATLHMNTTAEGVETEAQFEFLAAAGCTEIQGYLFSRPVPAAALPALIERLSGQQTLSWPAIAAVSG